MPPTSRSEHSNLLALASRIGVWLLLFGVIYVLRSFFLLIFLTFVFAYIQATGVKRLEKRIESRTLRVILVVVALLSVIIAVGFFVIPRVKEQAQHFVDRFPYHIQTIDAEIRTLAKTYPVLQELIPEMKNTVSHEYGTSEQRGLDLKGSPTTQLLQNLFGLGEESVGKQSMRHSLETIRNIGSGLLAITSAFLLSLLFSFLIVLDLPQLSASVRELRNTRVRFIYEEVSESICNFAMVFGRAIEAQLFVAMLNTLLTALGIFLLGFGEQIPFLCVIVFFCSFIPVAGVFISSIPICLVALQEAGLTLLFLAALMIIVVHLVETYILNPKIYGHHMRMNPVIVLIILTVGGKMFHIWGLILGVPICTYIFGHAIRNRPVAVK